MYCVYKEKTVLRSILLNEKELPWVESALHLGCKITNNIHGLPKDIMEKRAQYINKANELNQKFYFADTLTRIKINNTFNTSFYGSQIWDLFNQESERVEKTWNTSQRVLLRIPRVAQRYFIEPLSETQYIKFSLLKRFTNFVHRLSNSSKCVLRHVLSTVKTDCRSTTGNNLRNIMLLVNKISLDDVTSKDLDKQIYAIIPQVDKWKVHLAKEIIEVKNKKLQLQILSYKDLDDVLEAIIT